MGFGTSKVGKYWVIGFKRRLGLIKHSFKETTENCRRVLESRSHMGVRNHREYWE